MIDIILNELYYSSDEYIRKSKPLFSYVLKNFNEQEYDNVNKLLKEFSPEKADITCCIGILRLTFSKRLVLNEWYSCRDKIITHFININVLNYKQLLRGLLDE